MGLPVIEISQMREWEKATWASGQTEAEVIRRVGKSVGRLALGMTRDDDLILILTGKGNNGADARAAREQLAQRRVDVLEVKDPQGDLAKLEALLSLRPGLIIDGLFGIGINRPLDGAWVKFLQTVNETRAQVLAVDLPSGLNADTGEPQGAAIRATVTLTVGAPKIGLLKPVAWPFVGRLEMAQEVGLVRCPLTSELQWTLAQDFLGYPPRRAAATHKGTYGHLAIIAGSMGYHGAAVLAARGAQRAQPGLITLNTMDTVYHSVAPQMQAVMVSAWAPATRLAGAYSAVLIGPGLAAADLPEELRTLTRHLWGDAQHPLVVDASALDWLPLETPPKNAIRVITPHPGEAARLLRMTPAQVQANRPAAVRGLSRRFGNTWVVLKGHQTMIGSSSGEVHVKCSGNAHLAQGGSGDLLAGYLAGLLAQPDLCADPLKTIRYAVWQHGASADRLQQTSRHWVVEDLAQTIGAVEPQGTQQKS